MQDDGEDRRTLLYQNEHSPHDLSLLFSTCEKAYIHQRGTGVLRLEHQLRAAWRPVRSAVFPYPRTWVTYLRQIISITHGFAFRLLVLGPSSSWDPSTRCIWCCSWLFPIPPPMRGGRKWSLLLPKGKSLIFMTLHRTCTHSGKLAATCGDEAECCCAPYGATKVNSLPLLVGLLVEGGLPVKLGVKLLISITDHWTYTHGFEPPGGWFGSVFTSWPKLPAWSTGTGVVCTLPWCCPWPECGSWLNAEMDL